MTRALSDFRIENERVVLLSFSDGHKCRVSPQDLHRYVAAVDRVKIEEALHMRKQFIKRILPPTVMSVLVAAVLGIGGYDAYHMSNMVAPRATDSRQNSLSTQTDNDQPSTSTSSIEVAPVSASPASNSVAPAATGSGVQSKTASTGPVTATGGNTPQNTNSLVQPAANTLDPVINTLTQPLVPVTSTFKDVTNPLLRSLLK